MTILPYKRVHETLYVVSYVPWIAKDIQIPEVGFTYFSQLLNCRIKLISN